MLFIEGDLLRYRHIAIKLIGLSVATITSGISQELLVDAASYIISWCSMPTFTLTVLVFLCTAMSLIDVLLQWSK